MIFFLGWQRRECRKWTGKKKKVSQIDWQRRGKLWFCDANGQLIFFGWKLTRTQRSFVEWVPDQTGHCLNHVKCHFSILLLTNTPTIKRLLQIANKVH